MLRLPDIAKNWFNLLKKKENSADKTIKRSRDIPDLGHRFLDSQSSGSYTKLSVAIVVAAVIIAASIIASSYARTSPTEASTSTLTTTSTTTSTTTLTESFTTTFSISDPVEVVSDRPYTAL